MAANWLQFEMVRLFGFKMPFKRRVLKQPSLKLLILIKLLLLNASTRLSMSRMNPESKAMT